MAKKAVSRTTSWPRSVRVLQAEVGKAVQVYIDRDATDVEVSKMGEDDYLVRADKKNTYTAVYEGEALPPPPEEP